MTLPLTTRLGRQASSSRHFNRDRALPRVFDDDRNPFSMDRLGSIPRAESISIAQSFFVDRPNNFHGWAVVTVQDIRDLGCAAKLTPQTNNTEHCDVEIPIDVWIDDDRLKNLRVALADVAVVERVA